MTTTTRTELEVFHRFLGDRLKAGKRELTVEESVEAFRAYQRDLERLREEVRPAFERSLRSESQPFDPEDIIQRGSKRLMEKGIPN